MEKIKEVIVPVLAIFFSVFGAIFLFAILFADIPKENMQLASTCLGLVSTFIGTVLGYYFGSSKSSTLKDETIKNISANQNNP